MTSSPDEIREEIEQTRRDLASNVDNLHEKVSPSAVASRKVESAKSAVSNVKDKVMGNASSTTSGVGDTFSSTSSTVTSTPDAARQKTRGNPMAAGMIAFGAGWLISSLLPASEREKQAAMQVKDKASEHSDALTAPAKEMAANLKEPAQQAAESLKATATDATATVKDEAQSAKDDVAGHAQEAKDNVQGSSGTSGTAGSLGGDAYDSSTDISRPIGSTPGSTF